MKASNWTNNKETEQTVTVTPLKSLETRPDEHANSDLTVGGANQSFRYQLGDEIARGGMGVVIRGRDKHLGRDLAVKVMLESQQQRPDLFQRFVEEAQIGGQLQHPGIVPVYDLGQLSDHRPFFAMKLVKGETLSALLQARESPAEDLPRFLGIFEQVCQTMAYAHAKLVIHRDLKPINVMVGAFGEVQVMDWGLAKVLSQDEQSETKTSTESTANTVIQTVRTADSAADDQTTPKTQSGSVLGTPAYMSPEQAIGQIEILDTRSDVFSLGAMLCEILTGQPPYVASNASEVHRMALRCDLADCRERLAKCGCDPSLTALVTECLAPNPEDRASDAGDVARFMTSYLESVADRLKAAEINRAAADARAEESAKTAVAERKRRRISAAFASAIVVFMLVGGAGYTVFQRNQAALVKAKSDAKLDALEREKERTAELETRRQNVLMELAKCESLIQSATQTEVPTTETLQAIADAAKRASVGLADANDPTLAKHYQEVVEANLSLITAVQLRQDLDKISVDRIEEMITGKSHAEIYSSDGWGERKYSQVTTGVNTSAAFDRWGLQTSESPNDVAQRLGALPTWVRGKAIVALHQWHLALDSETILERSSRTKWSALSSGSLVSKGGAVLTEIDDHVILATGPNPNGDQYELLFPLPASEFNALKIEALTDPNNGVANSYYASKSGPGRGLQGDCDITNIEIFIHRIDNASPIRKLEIASVEVDHCFPGSVLTPTTWNLGQTFNGQIEPRDVVGVFLLEAPFSCEKLGIDRDSVQTLVRLQFQQPEKERDGKNLGRFRLSVCKLETDTGLTRFFSDVFARLQENQWQQKLWQAVATKDMPAMLKLAEDTQTDNQPEQHLIVLAETMTELGEAWHSTQLTTQAKWFTTSPKHQSADLDCRSDGSFNGEEASGPPLLYELDERLGMPVALRLDTFNPANVPFEFSEIQIALGEIQIPSPLERGANQPHWHKYRKASSNHFQFFDSRVLQAIDSERRTNWRVVHPPGKAQSSLILQLEPLNFDDRPFEGKLSVRFLNGPGGLKNTRHNYPNANIPTVRMRCSWAYELPQDVLDPREVAHKLLLNRLASHPESNSLLMALAFHTVLSHEPNYSDASDYALAAISKRPNDPSILNAFVRLAMLSKLPTNSLLLKRAAAIAKRCDDLTGTNQSSALLAWHYVWEARATSGNEERLRIFKKIYNLLPIEYWTASRSESPIIGPDRIEVLHGLARALELSGDTLEAERLLKIAIDLNDEKDKVQGGFERNLIESYANLLARESRFNEAEKQWNLIRSWQNLLTLSASRGDFETAEKFFREAKRADLLALVLAEQGRIVEAKEVFERLRPYRRPLALFTATAMRDDLLFAIASDGSERTIQLLAELGITQTDISGLAWSLGGLVIERDEVKSLGRMRRPYKFGGFTAYGRFGDALGPTSVPLKLYQPDLSLSLAKILADSFPNSEDANLALALAYISVADWENAGATAELLSNAGLSHLIRSVLEFQKGNHAKAEELFRTAHRLLIDTDNHHYHDSHGRMLTWLMTRAEVVELRDAIEPDAVQLTD